MKGQHPLFPAVNHLADRADELAGIFARARTQGRVVHADAAAHILRAADELSAAARLLVTGYHKADGGGQ